MSRRPAEGFRRGPRVADRLTTTCHDLIASSQAAERAGDAVTALRYYEGVPAFRRGAHILQLRQLAGVRDEMTPWLWARWAAYQSTRVEDPGTTSGEALERARTRVLGLFHQRTMDEIWEAGEDPVPFVASVLGEDWVFHQLCTFEHGGLRAFVEGIASGRMAAKCTLATRWYDAPMRGLRVSSVQPQRLRVVDLGRGEEVELLDLGAAVHPAPTGEEFLLGRLVPSGTEPELMLDTRPLVVDEETAVQVASADPPDGWVGVLLDAVVAGRVPASRLRSADRELLTDVPSLDLVYLGTPRSALDATLDSLHRCRDEVGRAAYRILRGVADGNDGPATMAPYVAAAVLNAHAYEELRRRGPGRAGCWEPWLPRVAGLARHRLQRLAAAAAA